MSLQSIVAANLTLGLVLAALLLAVAIRNRSYLRELSADPEPGWRRLPRVAALVLSLLIVWISLFDNWRQLTAIPFRATRHYHYQRILIDPPSNAARAVTLVLLALALILCGALFARHIGGYAVQLVVALGAAVGWLPFFVIRQRFAIDLAMGFSGSWRSVTDVGGYVAYVLLGWGFEIGLILISFVALLGVAALPITLLLDLTRHRRPRPTTEAVPFFNTIGHRAGNARH